MFLRYASISNFRALADVEAEFDKPISVIVGPNASGKTTLLEAIRLAKAVLAPRTPNEANQALMAVGAISPHLPGRLRSDAIARDLRQPTVIRTHYRLEPAEISLLENSTAQVATNLVRSQLGQQFASPAGVLAFLSSALGMAQLKAAEDQVRLALKAADTPPECRLELIIDHGTGRLSSPEPMGPMFFSFLEQRFPPSVAAFSYFPADRALPIGEPPIQLGAADVSNQLEAHNSQPQLKFARLKNLIFSAVISSEDGRQSLDREFRNIFENLLKGRSLESVGVNEIGLLSIRIRDTETNGVFDIDAMSSGEKGLILTSLMITRSIADGGIVLLDEPELHLNPAVCKDLVGFFWESYAKPRGMQMILCSHSAEILNAIFDRNECALYHLSSGSVLTPVHKQDREEISQALRRLGTSEAEGLLYKATIFLEGEHDVELLESGFPTLLRPYSIRELGGRGEVERQIARLQAAEKKGQVVPPTFFIFDHDRKPARLTGTARVRVLQWDRYCLENYLLDRDVIADLLLDGDAARIPLPERAEANRFIKSLWEAQLNDVVVRSIYASYALDFPAIKGADLCGSDFESIARLIHSRASDWREKLEAVGREAWCGQFVSMCSNERQKLQNRWERNWEHLCDGKRFFSDLAREIPLRMGLVQFKKRVITEMNMQQRPAWLRLRQILGEFLGGT